MKINVYIELYGQEWAYVAVFHKIYKKIVSEYSDIDFKLIDAGLMRDPKTYVSAGCKYGPFFMILENDDTKKYIVISYWDKLKNLTIEHDVTNWDISNCVEIIASSGAHDNDLYYAPLNVDYTPFSYICARSENENIIEKLYAEKSTKKYPDILSFRGYIYGFREYLMQTKKYNIIPIHTSHLPSPKYLAELSGEYLNFSINGAGEICHRDMEILGLGNALFRMKLVGKFHTELIPNYHYIAIDCDDIPKNIAQYDYWALLHNRIIDRFEEIKTDYDFIKYIGENGRKWYLENGTINTNADIAFSLLNFSKLQ